MYIVQDRLGLLADENGESLGAVNCGPGGGGIGAQGGRDGYAAQGVAQSVQVVKECTPEPKEIVL